jgi:bifunctional non-homologous end joining protein LigD
MLPTLVDEPPEGGGWIHEVKIDGYRSQFIKEPSGSRIFTRNGFDWSAKYAPLVTAADGLELASAIIDGEIIVPDPDTGLTDFQALRSAIRKAPGTLIFVAFDLLHLNGHDLRGMTLEERRHLWRT